MQGEARRISQAKGQSSFIILFFISSAASIGEEYSLAIPVKSKKHSSTLTCSISGGNCTVSILGVKEKNYKVEINNVTTGSTPFKTEYQNDESLEAGAAREILEEFGIEVEVKEQLYFRNIKEDLDEYLFRCVYKAGTLGTGEGPEFSGDPKYADRGSYIPTVVPKEKMKEIRLLPEEFREKLLKDFNLL